MDFSYMSISVLKGASLNQQQGGLGKKDTKFYLYVYSVSLICIISAHETCEHFKVSGLDMVPTYPSYLVWQQSK